MSGQRKFVPVRQWADRDRLCRSPRGLQSTVDSLSPESRDGEAKAVVVCRIYRLGAVGLGSPSAAIAGHNPGRVIITDANWPATRRAGTSALIGRRISR